MESNNYKISVVIPTHNRAELLQRAVKSIQNQTVQVDEIIIVSDGSTDNTDQVVAEMSKKDARIKYISYHPGHNGNYARNQGIGAATGNLIAFLDDDDEWLPKKTESQIKVFIEHPEYGLVYGAQRCHFVDINVTYNTKPSRCGDLSKRIFYHNDIGNPSQIMVRREVLDEAGIFDLNLLAQQDYDLWIRCCQVTQIGFTEEPCIDYYNTDATGQVSSNTEKYITARKYIAKKYEYLVQKYSKEEQKEIRAIDNMQIAQRCLRNGQKSAARKYLSEAMKIKFMKKQVALYVASFFSYKTILKVRSRFKY